MIWFRQKPDGLEIQKLTTQKKRRWLMCSITISVEAGMGSLVFQTIRENVKLWLTVLTDIM